MNRPRAFLVAAALALAGCDGGGHEDLAAFVAAATPPSEGPGAVPAATTQAPFSYGAASLRDPFQAARPKPAGGDPGGAPPPPDPSRPKAPLERFTIGQLRMVGSLSRGGLPFALVQDANGRLHRVGRGDFLGTDFGRARAIDAAGIDVVETISDGAGGWARRERRITLTPSAAATEAGPGGAAETGQVAVGAPPADGEQGP